MGNHPLHTRGLGGTFAPVKVPGVINRLTPIMPTWPATFLTAMVDGLAEPGRLVVGDARAVLVVVDHRSAHADVRSMSTICTVADTSVPAARTGDLQHVANLIYTRSWPHFGPIGTGPS